MKTLALIVTAFFSINLCYSQEFTFQMKFVDAAGNKDSLVMGYDPAGTDSLDPSFSEVNVVSTPINNNLDARTGNKWFMDNLYWQYGQTPYETKTQIVQKTCGSSTIYNIMPVVEIHLVSENFPVTATWSSTLFNNTCSNGCIFTGWAPVGWWDVGPGGFVQFMHTVDSLTFQKSQYTYLSGNDTVNLYWMILSDSSWLGVGINEPLAREQSFGIYPNPAMDMVNLTIEKSFGQPDRIEFYNCFGQIVLTTKQSSNISIEGYPAGLYFIKVTNKKGQFAINKFQKI